jgi:eukaryotic-like serine/threonine-protein kinase
MALGPGARLGPYEVTALLGEGGMGKVWRAHHGTLNRDDALKVLPDAFANDPERLSRFQREAQVLASLNHPNIAHVYGFEQADGTKALIMELVEGPTLADRIARGPIPIHEALPIAKQIAEALEAAHEHGIVHRDLKPANIKVREDDTVKVLDFGLAKAFDREPNAIDSSQSPTVTSPAMTRVGVILGTAAYMAPEQARGRLADRRSDVWSFGCVVYEMLTGRRAFEGADVTDVLVSVISKEPNWTILPAAIPASIRKLLRRCLEKDRKARLPDIGVVRLEIDDTLAEPTQDIATLAGRRDRSWRGPTPVAAIALTIAAASGLAAWRVVRPSTAAVVRLTVAPPMGEVVGTTIPSDPDVTISADGTRIVYVGSGGEANVQQLYVRSLDQLEVRPLQGLGTPRSPFLSPDSSWVGFFDGTALKKVSVNGGPAVTIRDLGTTQLRGASWSDDNTIIFATAAQGTGLLRIPANGGEPEVLTRPDLQKGELDHIWPEVLPGGDAVLFTILPIVGGIENAQIAVVDLRTREPKILVAGGSNPHYVPTGHLVFGLAGTMRAVAFDIGSLEARSEPLPVVQQVVTKSMGPGNFAIAQNGTLVYIAGEAQRVGQTLVWVDRQGREQAIKAPSRAYTYPRLSPDGTKAAISVLDQENDVWVWDFKRETLTRLTFDPGLDRMPVWTPDGRRIVFSSQRAGADDIFWQAADGTGPVERLTDSTNTQEFPTSFAPDGTRLVFRRGTPNGASDIGMLSLGSERRVTVLMETPFAEWNAEVSPNGRWVAYQSSESGRDEIYVRPFPNVESGRWQVSTGGGTRPLWARNGRELFYLVGQGRLMSVSLQPDETFLFGNPQVVFDGPYLAPQPGRTYDVSPDGQRFLMIKESGGDNKAVRNEIVVVLNWFQDLKRLVPAN